MLDYVAAAQRRLFGALLRLRRDRRAVTAVEYGVLGALVLLVCVAAISTLGTVVFVGLYTEIANATTAAVAR